MASEVFISLGIFLVLIGFALLIIGSMSTKNKTKAEGGFALWIGPFPIIGATNKQMFYSVLLISALVFAILLILNKSFF